ARLGAVRRRRHARAGARGRRPPQRPRQAHRLGARARSPAARRPAARRLGPRQLRDRAEGCRRRPAAHRRRRRPVDAGDRAGRRVRRHARRLRPRRRHERLHPRRPRRIALARIRAAPYIERMKLFYSNGSCSLASHITLEEAGAKFEAVRVDLRAGEQKKPEYLAINPKGKVPALVVDAGVITENPAIMSYVADTHPQAKLLAAPGDFARAKAQEWLAWCASTVHRDFSPLFRDKDNADQLKLVQGHLDQLDAWLK